MLEKFMMFSVFLTILCTFIILGILVLAGLYILAEHIKDKRRETIQKKLDVIFSDRRKEDTDDDY